MERITENKPLYIKKEKKIHKIYHQEYLDLFWHITFCRIGH